MINLPRSSENMTYKFKIGQEYSAKFKRTVCHRTRFGNFHDFIGYTYKDILCVDRSETEVTFVIPYGDKESRVRTVPITMSHDMETAVIPYERNNGYWYKPLLLTSRRLAGMVDDVKLESE